MGLFLMVGRCRRHICIASRGLGLRMYPDSHNALFYGVESMQNLNIYGLEHRNFILIPDTV